MFNGEIWTVNIRHGKLFFIAAANRHFTQLKARGVWEEILDSLVIMERKKSGKESTPSLLAIDSQSVKIVQFTNQEIGIDGGKNINGRKRTILVDTLGLPFQLRSPQQIFQIIKQAF